MLQYGCKCLICGLRESFFFQKGMTGKEILQSISARGLLIKRHFICNDCQEQILYLTPGSLEYPKYLEKIKELWL